MTVTAIRFRNEGDFVVLQVLGPKPDHGNRYIGDQQDEWRDAQVTDLLEVARFTRDPVADSLAVGSEPGLKAQYIGPRQMWAP
jgi:hypothetical protein